MKLQTKVFGLTAIIFLTHFSVGQYIGHEQAKSEVINNISREVRIVRGMLMSVRDVYQQIFIEHSVPITKTTLNFLPAHSLSRISETFKNWVDSGLTFNNVSDQPRNPDNMADEIEMQAIEYFRSNPNQLERLIPYTNKNGDAYYHFSQPIWITEKCLKCHGKEEESPESIRNQYSNAFGYQTGDLRGLMSIKLPAQAIETRINRQFLQSALSHAIGLVVTFLFLSLLFRYSVLHRITHLKTVLAGFATGDNDVVINTQGNDEIGEISVAIDNMLSQIKEREQLLTINKSLFAAISETNKAIVRMSSPEQLYQNICRIAVDFGGMDSAMVTLLPTDRGRLDIVACAGKLASKKSQLLFPRQGDNHLSGGAISVAAKEKRSVIVNNLDTDKNTVGWQQLATELGIASAAAFPCILHNNVIGVFSVFKNEADFFSSEIISLFEEMTNEIIFGINNFQQDLERKKLHDKLLITTEQSEKAQNQLSLLLESTGEGIFGVDTDGNCTFINHAAQNMLGLPQDEVLGQRIHELTHHSHTDGSPYKAEECPIYNAYLTGTPIQIADEIFWRKSGQAFPVEYSAYPIREYGVITGVVTVFRDISERYELNRKMDFLSTHDTLTGLYNRSTFKQRLSMALEESTQGGYQSVLCYLDIDRFMIINDTYGYIAGDATLQLFADLVHSLIRKTDILSRLTADEFGLYLHDCSLEQAEALCRKICTAVSRHRFSWQGKSLQVSVSIGITRFHHDTGSVDSILNTAHSACYVAKEKGRNQIYIQQGSEDEVAKRTHQIQWISNIQSAIDDDRLRLHFQTIKPTRPDTDTGEHFEILLRMLNADGENVPPDSFIPIAEKFDMMPTIDRWVIGTTLNWLQENPDRQADIQMCSINLSGHSLGDESVLDFIRSEFKHRQVNPEKICFEVTETAAINSIEHAIHFMCEIKKLGCCFALDDFGTGMSSFAYLKNMPVDFLKIDGSFIKDILDDPVSRAMVISINEIGRVMGLKTIAEYVENEQIEQVLKEIGVDYLQGFGIARPVPLCNRD